MSTYNNPAAGVYLRALPQFETVYDGTGNTVAQTEYRYDESSPLSAPGIVQHLTVGSQRGNLTSLRRWRNMDGAWLTTSKTYDVAGNVMSVISPGQSTTSYTYTDCYPKYAFLTTVIGPQWPNPTTLGHDCSLGEITSITHPNGFQTTAEYGHGADFGGGDDVLDRLSKVIRPNGQQIAYRYSQDLTTVTTKSDQTVPQDQVLKSAAVTDGLGRAIETRLYTSASAYISSKKDLDALGRTRKAYNPGSVTDATAFEYDALGRVRTTTYADGSVETFAWTGDTVLHTDPASKKRKQQVDALGRTISVTKTLSGRI